MSVRWGIHVVDVGTGEVCASTGADEVFRTASVGKIVLLLEVARGLEAGELTEGELLAPVPGDAVRDSGLWWHLHTRALPVADCAALVGAFSDNLATNVLLRRVGGAEALADKAAAWAVGEVGLHDYVRDERGPQDPPTLSTATAEALTALAVRIHRGTVLTPKVCLRVREWLALDADLSMVAGVFGLDPLCHTEPDRGVSLWHKTGTNSQVRADVGVVQRGDRALAYAVLANWEAGEDASVRDGVLDRMRSVGTRIREGLAAG